MITASQVAEILNGELIGVGSLELKGIAPADTAVEGDLTFAERPDYFAAAEASGASVILTYPAATSSAPTPSPKTLIRVPNPRIALARILPHFFPPDPLQAGIDPTARISPSASVHPTAQIGPGCVLGDHVRVGARTHLHGGNHVGRNATIGDDCSLFPNVVLYPQTQIGHRVLIHAGSIIGSDGYGYVFDQGIHRKILHIGRVIVQDDVEIGANACIDRGALGSTVIGKGTKIDNLVHIAHNVTLGRHCLVMGQVGFAGSTRVGDYSVIASQSGIAGHLTLGPRATVGAKSGVMRDVGEGETVLGIPAAPDKQAKRQWVAIQQLPDLVRRLRALEKSRSSAPES